MPAKRLEPQDPGAVRATTANALTHASATFELKPLGAAEIPSALERAARYRLQNEPLLAESICRDVLAVDAANQRALALLILALSDRFGLGRAQDAMRAQEAAARLRDPRERAYYTGVICERLAEARLDRAGPGSHLAAFDLFEEAMRWYEKAEGNSGEGAEDARQRWNACARTIMNHKLEPPNQERFDLASD